MKLYAFIMPMNVYFVKSFFKKNDANIFPMIESSAFMLIVSSFLPFPIYLCMFLFTQKRLLLQRKNSLSATVFVDLQLFNLLQAHRKLSQ